MRYTLATGSKLAGGRCSTKPNIGKRLLQDDTIFLTEDEDDGSITRFLQTETLLSKRYSSSMTPSQQSMSHLIFPIRMRSPCENQQITITSLESTQKLIVRERLQSCDKNRQLQWKCQILSGLLKLSLSPVLRQLALIET